MVTSEGLEKVISPQQWKEYVNMREDVAKSIAKLHRNAPNRVEAIRLAFALGYANAIVAERKSCK